MKTILKFDTGARGFKRAVYVLVIGAILLLLLGAYFVYDVLRSLKAEG
ncbi:MAG: hypothetical protein HY706_19010 [Candidatus Hydrogenedentes bacterium]|nr:hypothetical protein [Candidatus Hydrogenedentota bacterium]